jgi:hypothetical protein
MDKRITTNHTNTTNFYFGNFGVTRIFAIIDKIQEKTTEGTEVHRGKRSKIGFVTETSVKLCVLRGGFSFFVITHIGMFSLCYLLDAFSVKEIFGGTLWNKII